MQTFLPYADFKKSALVLDVKRLGKQRVECMQLLNALTNPTAKGWVNHPACRMWRNYESWLVRYTLDICETWSALNYKDTVREKVLAKYGHLPKSPKPFWLGDQGIHISHQSNLVRKNAAFYGPLFPGVPADLPYVWPV